MNTLHMVEAVRSILGHNRFSARSDGTIIQDGVESLAADLPGFQAAYDAAAAQVAPREIEFRDFMDLFTQAEQTTIMAAAQISPSFALWIARAQGGPTMSLDHPDTAQGLQELVDAELLTAARRDEVLAHQP